MGYRVMKWAVIALMGGAVSGQAQELALPTVQVQAQKQPQDAQGVALSMEVWSQEQLEASRQSDLFNLHQLSPSLTGGGLARVGIARLGIRGINDFARNQGFEGSVGVYVDGVYAGRQQGVTQSLAGIDQVEVLRGPQGTLLGRNTVAGAVMLTTRKPEERPAYSAMAERGAFGLRRLALWAGGPLPNGGGHAEPLRMATGVLLGAVTVAHSGDEGYVRNLFRTDNRPTAHDNGLLRSQLRWKGRDGAVVDMSLETFAHRGQRYNAEAVEVGSPAYSLAAGPWTTAVDTRSTERIERRASVLAVQWPLGGGWLLHSLTGLQRHLARYDDAEGDWTPAELIETDFAISRTRQVSQEFRLSRTWGPGRHVLAGLHAIDQQNAEQFSSATGADFPAPGSPQRSALANRRTLGDGRLHLRGRALFTHAEWLLTPQWGAVAGVRLTDERKTVAFSHAADAALAAVGLYPLAPFEAALAERDLSPRFGVTARVAPDVMVYATQSTAFKSGGYNLDGITSVLTDPARQLRFEREKVVSREVGWKSQWWQRRLRLNAALYDAHGRDYQVQQFVPLPSGGTAIAITNAARVSLRGVEVDARWRMGTSWEGMGGLHRGRAVFDDFRNGGGIGVHHDGKRLPFAPDRKWMMGLRWRDQLAGIPVHGSLRYTHVGTQYSNADNRARNTVAPYGIVGAQLGASGARRLAGWSLSAWVENAGNTAYLVSQDRSFTGVIKGAYGPPRTVGVTLALDS